MNLLLAALQGLASLPKLIEAVQSLADAWRAREVAEYKKEVSLVIEKLKQDPTPEDRKQAARDLQDLVSRL